MQAANNTTCQIYWYDDALMVYPMFTCVKKALIITEKNMEYNPKKHTNETVRRRLPLFEEFDRGGKKVAVTYPGFMVKIGRILMKNKIRFNVADMRTSREVDETFPEPRLDLMHGFRFSQEELVTKLLTAKRSGLLGAPTRYGKCLYPNVKVLMYDGTIRKAREIQKGDEVMGVDGKPRTVMGCTFGRAPGYEIIPDKGTPWKCNDEHILVVRDSSKKEVCIRAKDLYTALNPESNRHQVAAIGYNLLYKPLPQMNRKSKEVDVILAKIQEDSDACITGKWRRIPDAVFTASKKARTSIFRQVLRELTHAENKKTLREGIIRLGRSIGHQVTYEDNKIVVKFLGASKPTLSGFKMRYIKDMPYYGFELDGEDGKFLLWDHCVTHNTTLMINTIRAYPTIPIVVTAPGVDLVKQTYKDICEKIPGRDIRLLCTGSKHRKPSTAPDGITVAIGTQLHKCDQFTTKLVLVDEPHAFPADKNREGLDGFRYARRLGFGATLDGRFDGRDAMIEGLIGDVIVERTYREAVDEGAICPLKVLMLEIPLSTEINYEQRTAAYNHILRGERLASTVRDLCDEAIPSEWQTLVFIKDEPQVESLLRALGEDKTVAMAKRMTNAERDAVTAKLAGNVIKRCLCSNIYVQGVTFSDVRVIVNAAGGGDNTTAIQKPGRLLEIRPGKKWGIMIDFKYVSESGHMCDLSTGMKSLVYDSNNRFKAYTRKGYDIEVHKTVEQIKDRIAELE